MLCSIVRVMHWHGRWSLGRVSCVFVPSFPPSLCSDSVRSGRMARGRSSSRCSGRCSLVGVSVFMHLLPFVLSSTIRSRPSSLARPHQVIIQQHIRLLIGFRANLRIALFAGLFTGSSSSSSSRPCPCACACPGPGPSSHPLELALASLLPLFMVHGLCLFPSVLVLTRRHQITSIHQIAIRPRRELYQPPPVVVASSSPRTMVVLGGDVILR